MRSKMQEIKKFRKLPLSSTSCPRSSKRSIKHLSTITGLIWTGLQCLQCWLTVCKRRLSARTWSPDSRGCRRTTKVTEPQWLWKRKGWSFSCSKLNFTSSTPVWKRNKCWRCTKWPSGRSRPSTNSPTSKRSTPCPPSLSQKSETPASRSSSRSCFAHHHHAVTTRARGTPTQYELNL